MHNAFRFTGRTRRIEQLDDRIRKPAPLEKQTLGVALGLPRRLEQNPLEALLTTASDHQHPLQMRQLRTDAAHHRRIVEATILARYDEDLALGEAQHEFDLALAKDRHHRIYDGAYAPTCEHQRRELPPVGELTGNDIVVFDAQLGKAYGQAVDQGAEFPIAQAPAVSFHRVEIDDGRFVRNLSQAAIEVIGEQLVPPIAASTHLLAARFDHHCVEFHVPSLLHAAFIA